MKFDVSYTFDATNNYTINIGTIPAIFNVFYCLICFRSNITDLQFTLNEQFEVGNIETFLSNDTYYPFRAIGTRYSFIQPFDYVQNGTNCLRTQYGNRQSIPIALPQQAGNPWIAFLDTNGIVRGPKEGVEIGSSSVLSPTYTLAQMREVLDNITYRWNSSTISPGIVETMLPDILSVRTECMDYETVYQRNMTIYNNLGPDPRNNLDGTRNQGVFPKCASPSCTNGQFVGKLTNNVYQLHDQLFRAEIAIQLATELLTEIQAC